MRWLALVLVLVSIAIYYLPDFVGPSGGMANVASGSLPRVASLKSPGPADSGVGPGAPADESEMSCARLGWIEPRSAPEAWWTVNLSRRRRVSGLKKSKESWPP